MYPFQPPQIVSVEVVRGQKFPTMDFSLFRTRAADPYCILSTPGNFFQMTTVIETTLNPTWNQRFHFPILNITPEGVILPGPPPKGPLQIEFTVYDYDIDGQDEMVGQAGTTVDPDLPADKELVLTLAIESKKSRKKPQNRGELVVRLLSQEDISVNQQSI